MSFLPLLLNCMIMGLTIAYDKLAYQLCVYVIIRALFTSKDKKQFILDMAGRNEIDPPFLQLIRQNIRSAEDAGQEDAAKFMKKLLDSCKRYETKPKAVKEETAPEIINTSA